MNREMESYTKGENQGLDTGPATKVLRRNNGTSAAEKRRRGERGPVDSASAVTAELRTSNEAGR